MVVCSSDVLDAKLQRSVEAEPEMYFHKMRLWIKVWSFEYQFSQMQMQLWIICTSISVVVNADTDFLRHKYFYVHTNTIDYALLSDKFQPHLNICVRVHTT